jgi:hypothetical protein
MKDEEVISQCHKLGRDRKREMGWRGRILRFRGETWCMTPILAPASRGRRCSIGGFEVVFIAPEYQNE